MAKSSTAAFSNPVANAVQQAIASGSIARSTCDALILNYSEVYPDELDALQKAIRNRQIRVQDRR